MPASSPSPSRCRRPRLRNDGKRSSTRRTRGRRRAAFAPAAATSGCPARWPCSSSIAARTISVASTTGGRWGFIKREKGKGKRGKGKGKRNKGKGTREKGQGTRDKGQGTAPAARARRRSGRYCTEAADQR